MKKLPLAELDIERLRLFCNEAERILKQSPSIMTRDTLGKVDKMVANEEKYGVLKILLSALFETIHSRMIYGELGVEDTLTIILDVAKGNLLLTSPESCLPHFVGPPKNQLRSRSKIAASV
jgi:hypothetical protein